MKQRKKFMKQTKKISRKVISVVLSLLMVFSCFSGLSMTAYAAGASYVDGSGESQTVNSTELEAATTNWANGSWYIVPEGGLTISGRITVNGTVNLILRDGATLTANAGITTTNATLNIYAQSAGTGALTAKGSNGNDSALTSGSAGIGGIGGSGDSYGMYPSSPAGSGGTVNIYGGTVTATGGNGVDYSYLGAGAGIGGGGGSEREGANNGGAGGTVNIFGGTVTATGGNAGKFTEDEAGSGTGIGGGGKGLDGSDGASGTLTLGAGVKLYNGTNNSGTVLDGSDSTERSYSGSRPQNMFAETVKKVKPAQTVTTPTAATSLTYKKNQAQALLTRGASVTTGNTAEGSIQYKIGTDGTWTSEIPKATNAGTYNVYYKVLEDETYAEYAPTEPISVTIAKADPEIPTGITAKYCDYTGIIKLPDGWTWQDDWYFFETVGTDTCKADFEGNDNYNAMTGVDIIVAVEKADAAISYEKTEVSVEYGAEFGKNEITNPGDADPTFTSSNESVATVSKTGYVTIKGIGETTIKATIEDNEHYHYTTTEASYKLTVNPVKTVVNTAPIAAELTYGQKLSESTLTGGAAVSHGSSVAGTFVWKEPDLVPNASESGEYDVVFTPTDTRYAKSTGKVKVKVNKAAAPATKESLSPKQKPAAKNSDDLVYTGEPIELVTAPTNPLGGYKVQYSKDNGTTWTDTIPTETNVGTYTVKVKYVSDNYENIDLDDITVKITPVSK